MNHKEKLAAFSALVQQQQLEQHAAMGYTHPGWERYADTTVHVAKKYTRVDVGSSGKFMVVNDTGEIFGIKGYGVIHRGHRFGTLDTINDWYWGDYAPRKVEGVLA